MTHMGQIDFKRVRYPKDPARRVGFLLGLLSLWRSRHGTETGQGQNEHPQNPATPVQHGGYKVLKEKA